MSEAANNTGEQLAAPAWLALACWLTCASLAQAQQITVPNAGSLLNEVQPAQPAAPVPSRSPLQSPTANIPEAEQQLTFVIRDVQIEGNKAIDTDTLKAQIAGDIGKPMSFFDVRLLAIKLSNFYRQQGFPFSRVVVPQQDVTSGTLKLLVVEARFGQVLIDNNGRARTALLEDIAAPLRSGEVIMRDTLDRVLLLMTDVPTANVTATVRPGAQVGTSDLQIAHNTAPLFAARVGLDNSGNRFIERARATASLLLQNPTGQGDQANLDLLTSGEGMNYVRASYELMVSGQGTAAGVNVSHLNYALGGALAPLDASGSALGGGLFVRHPLVRLPRMNVNLLARADRQELRDRIGIVSQRTDRNLDTVTLGASGDLRQVIDGGETSWSTQWVNGRLKFEDATAAANDATTARTQGDFNKLAWSVSHRQTLDPRLSVNASLSGQITAENLDSAQKWVLGGANSVRAYDNSAVSGDRGFTASVELRRLLANWKGAIYGSVFYDIGRVRLNARPWQGVTGDQTVVLAGVGFGLNWQGNNQSLSLSWASPTEGVNHPAVANVRHGLAWLTYSVQF